MPTGEYFGKAVAAAAPDIKGDNISLFTFSG